jgi:DNA topoisomerase-1
MSKTLLIVESPAKAKTIKKYVGAGYEVLASKGHIKDLPKRGGVDIENGFQETYELLEEKGKTEVVKAIRAAAKKADKVFSPPTPTVRARLSPTTSWRSQRRPTRKPKSSACSSRKSRSAV